jgi:hypothetical protein
MVESGEERSVYHKLKVGLVKDMEKISMKRCGHQRGRKRRKRRIRRRRRRRKRRLGPFG